MNSNHLPMGRIDFSPLTKFSVGFDDMFESLLRVHDMQSGQTNYPPYNIVKYSNDEYAIEFAVAGFAYADIDVSIEGNSLTIEGDKRADKAENVEYLHRGISNRGFKRNFSLGDHLIVKDAIVKNGMLTINLARIVPEGLRPRKIAITSGD